MSRSVLGMLALTCGLLAAPVAGQGTVLSGIVRDANGIGVQGVEISVSGRAVPFATDTAGRYRLVVPATGVMALTARRLGYRPETRQVTVTGGQPLVVDFRLDLLAESLDAVTVVGKPQAVDRRLASFYERARLHNGGHFFMRDQLERSNAVNILQVIRVVPGLRVGGSSALGRAIRLRGNHCAPLVFIDGFAASAGPYDLESLDPASVEGIEVYSGSASIPPEFMGPRGLDQCGVIAVWGRQAAIGRRVPQPPKLTEAFMAASRVQAMIVSSLAYPVSGVDTPAEMHGEFSPIYPVALLDSRSVGRLKLEFVVDSTGTVMWETYSVVSSSDSRFDSPVREAIAAMKFVPARRAGRRIAQVIHLPVILLPPDAFNEGAAGRAAAATHPGPGTADRGSPAPSPSRELVRRRR